MNIGPLDLSKAPHPRIGDFLLTFVPGFLFEVFLITGNPDLVHRVVQRASAAVPVHYSVGIAAAIALAYCIGAVLLVFQRFVLFLMTHVYLWRWGRVVARREAIKERVKASGKADGIPSTDAKTEKLATEVFAKELNETTMHHTLEIIRLHLTDEVRKRRYGLPQLQTPTPEKIEAWRLLLRSPTLEEERGNQGIRALTAAVYGGIVCLFLAPELCHATLLLALGFILGIGLWHDYGIVDRWYRTVPRTYWEIVSLLRELKLPSQATESANQP
jgi:hypothetical protein